MAENWFTKPGFWEHFVSFSQEKQQPQGSLNFFQSGPRKFTKSDFLGLAPIRRVLNLAILVRNKRSQRTHDRPESTSCELLLSAMCCLTVTKVTSKRINICSSGNSLSLPYRHLQEVRTTCSLKVMLVIVYQLVARIHLSRNNLEMMPVTMVFRLEFLHVFHSSHVLSRSGYECLCASYIVNSAFSVAQSGFE